MKIKHLFFTPLLLISTAFAQQQPDLVHYVNTLQGTDSEFKLTRGNTYPTTALPFGMHTWTPQTGKNGDGWKYQYKKDHIRGFQQAHQCSSWTNDYAVFSVMPMSELEVNEDKREAKFSHANEIAKPNYYKVQFDNKITTEISPSERGAHLRFTYPSGKKSFLVLDGYTHLSGVKINAKANRITGWVNNGRGFHRGWKSYFVMQFDQPIKAYGTWDNKTNTTHADSTEAEGEGKGAYVQFKNGAKVQVKTASSYISLEQAELNLKRELGNDKTLEQTKANAAAVWNKSLAKITVEGGTEADRATFYSCFFRASLFSRKFYEIDAAGKAVYFSPYDGTVHPGYMFTDTGFWDTFRAQFPLNALVQTEMHGRYMQALIDAYKQCGWLPSWSFPSEAGSMVGNHAISLLADAWAKGIHTFDPKEALEAYFHEATNKGPWGPANGREGWKEYYELGYVPYPTYREATAKTLEYAYDDWCAYQLAKMTGNKRYMDIFSRQMYNYRNVYNPATHFMEGKDPEGKWRPNFDPTEWGGPFTEGNSWHYTWSVFHNIQDLINMMGGNANFNAKLDSVFSQPNKVNVGTYRGMIHEMTEMVAANMGQYAHGNQPIQHMIYLYDYAGEPWKAQFHARDAMYKLYNATEDGYPGDEDQGQTSSWYVLSAMGLYSVTPGTNQYTIGSPMFKKITLNLENGKKFVIDAPANDKDHVYIQSAALNGKNFTKNYITYDELTNGGELKLVMSDKPNQTRGTGAQDKPFSLNK